MYKKDEGDKCFIEMHGSGKILQGVNRHIRIGPLKVLSS